jgi:hypothetical protein
VENNTFKYKIGDKIDAMDGWELPLGSGKVINRRRIIVQSGSGYEYVNQYNVSLDKGYGTYTEDQLRPHVG